MTPHAVNWRRDYYYTAMGTEGTRALIGPSKDDSIGGDGVESDSVESDNVKDNSIEGSSVKDNDKDEDGNVDCVSPEDDTDCIARQRYPRRWKLASSLPSPTPKLLPYGGQNGAIKSCAVDRFRSVISKKI